MKKKFGQLLIATLALLIASGNAYSDHDGPRAILTVFGDSLLDSGNVPPITLLNPMVPLVIPPPTRYDRGRFQNGPNVADYLATRFRTELVPSNTARGANLNYAHGGAATGEENLTPGLFVVPGLLGQVNMHLEAKDHPIHPNTLHLIWAGANDYFVGLLLSQPTTPDNPCPPPPELVPSCNPPDVIANLTTAIEDLYAAGARRFVVFDLPNLGKTPLCDDFGICGLLEQLTLQHNALLDSALNDLKSLPDISIVKIDTFSLLERITAYPAAFGFSQDLGPGPAKGCLFQQPPSCDRLSSFATDQLFWDEQHLSTRAHKILSRVVLRKIIAERLFGFGGVAFEGTLDD